MNPLLYPLSYAAVRKCVLFPAARFFASLLSPRALSGRRWLNPHGVVKAFVACLVGPPAWWYHQGIGERLMATVENLTQTVEALRARINSIRDSL
jgi:hypothetical protein